MREGVNEAAKNKVPTSRPVVEIEHHSRETGFFVMVRALAIRDGSCRNASLMMLRPKGNPVRRANSPLAVSTPSP
jgi:hypothetical protein